MNAPEPVRVERRAGQRFEVHTPVTVKIEDRVVPGFSQDLSTKGVFFYTEAGLQAGDSVELTFTMPSEITLGENLRVRCHGRVLRSSSGGVGQRNGVAVCLDSYEYLTDEPPRLSPVASDHPVTESPLIHTD